MNLSAATSTGLFMCFATGFVTALTGARVDSALKIDKKRSESQLFFLLMGLPAKTVEVELLNARLHAG